MGDSKELKTYSDLAGDGGSNIMGQVVAHKAKIEANLSGIKYVIAVGSGKGGVGKSTISMHLASTFNRLGKRVSLLDADVNGPALARLAGLTDVPLIPGQNGLIVPKTKSGIGVISFGTLVPESEAVDFKSVSSGDSHVWRATKEFSTLADFLADTDWGELDFLLIDLPPGAERCFQFAEFFGSKTSFILITIPSEVSQGVVARSIAAIKKTPSPIIGYIENMSGYYCADSKEVKPLFPSGNAKLDIPLLGSVPFDPAVAEQCDRGTITESASSSPTNISLQKIATKIMNTLEA